MLCDLPGAAACLFFVTQPCLEVRQLHRYSRLLTVRQSCSSPYGHADRLRRVLPAVFFPYTVKIRDRNMFSQVPFMAD